MINLYNKYHHIITIQQPYSSKHLLRLYLECLCWGLNTFSEGMAGALGQTNISYYVCPPSDVNVGEHNPNLTSFIYFTPIHQASFIFPSYSWFIFPKHQKKHPTPNPQWNQPLNPPSIHRHSSDGTREVAGTTSTSGAGNSCGFLGRGESPLFPSSSHLGWYSWDMNVISGWWLGHPSEKYACQLGWLCPIYGKMKNVNQTTNQIWMWY